MSTRETKLCNVCGSTSELIQLERCRMCFKWFCTECGYRQSGRRFCSENCAQIYFYGDMDEDEQERLADDEDKDE